MFFLPRELIRINRTIARKMSGGELWLNRSIIGVLYLLIPNKKIAHLSPQNMNLYFKIEKNIMPKNEPISIMPKISCLKMSGGDILFLHIELVSFACNMTPISMRHKKPCLPLFIYMI